MVRDERSRRSPPCPDVRLHGFASRVSAAEAVAWVDAQSGVLSAEAIAIGKACGRVLHAPVTVGVDLPAFDRAADDGYAVRSSETIGAGPYNPIPLALQAPDTPLEPAGAAVVSAGEPLPRGADAVAPFGAASPAGASVEILAAVAEGTGVERRGRELRAGAQILAAGRALRAQDVALLAAVGFERVQVVRRPRVRLVVAGPKHFTGLAMPDADGPMLQALVRRDGGIAEFVLLGASDRGAIARSLTAPGADAILVAGRTGTGADDEAPLALAEVGELLVHGIAVRPGGSAAMGRIASVPVVLLPGEPVACLCAYELFGGRLIRRLGGRDPRLPHAVRHAEVGRKLISAVGLVDVCQVRLVDGRAEPIGSAEDGGLGSTVQADGFVLIPAPLEGHAPGARVDVHLYAPGARESLG